MKETKEDIDLTEDLDETDFNVEEPKSNLKEKYQEAFDEDAEKFAEKFEEKKEQNYQVHNATLERLKRKKARLYDVLVAEDREWTGEYEMVGEGKKKKIKIDPMTGDKVKKYIIHALKFKTRRPNDLERLDLARLGANDVQQLASMSDERYDEVNEKIAKHLSKMVLDPVLTADEWRHEVDAAVYQQLFFKMSAAAINPNDGELLDFLLMP